MVRWHRTGFAAIAAWAIVSTARATVAPPCSDLQAVPIPTPIAAGDPAILFRPNREATTFSLAWRDGENDTVAFEQRPVATGSRLYLVPDVPVTAGRHTLSYTDDCSWDADTVELGVSFRDAPPPPTRLGTLRWSFDAYCPGDGNGFIAYDYPPPVSIWLEAEPGLEPYAPLLTITLTDASDVINARFFGTTSAGYERSVACGSLSAAIPEGAYEVTAEGELLGYPALEAASTEVVVECADCPSGSNAPDGPEVDALQDQSDAGEGTGGCSIGPQSRAPTPFPWAFAAMILAVARRRPLQ